ncbi:MAG: STM4014 family protein [Blastocatellia bacterium]|nr:STM4014 family protein [Blastocatellia bacterium]
MSKLGSDWAQPQPFQMVVIGNPQGRRVQEVQTALAALNLPPARVLSYVDVITGQTSLAEVAEPGAVLRIDSPDKDFGTERAFLMLGAEQAAAEGCEHLPRAIVEHLEFEKGRLWPARQRYLGFCEVLRQIETQALECPNLRRMQTTEAIARMFDKVACHELFQAKGLPVPASLGTVTCFEALLERMKETGRTRVFVKLAHGSSASGVVAFQFNRDRFQATTTVEMVREKGTLKLYNSRKIRTYTGLPEISQLLDSLCRQRVQVEAWLPKAACSQGVFDLRMVVIGGQVTHIVVRTSRSPITNLHLLNERGNLEEIRQRTPGPLWNAVRKTCEQALDCFPGNFYAGVDVAITAGYRRHAVLEINAFGDLLPGVLHNNYDTYTTEILAWLNISGLRTED